VENKLKRNNEKYLSPIKQRIEQILKGEKSQLKLESFQKKIKSSWVFLMDILVEENKEILSLKKVYEIGGSFGLKPETIEEMLKFYNETGTIVYFGKDLVSNEEENDKNFVIINPQWLLSCLGCVMYDVEFHGTNKTKVDPTLIEDAHQLETNGLLSRELLVKLLEHVSEEEQEFIEHLCLRKNLMSKFIFKAGENKDNVNLDSDKFLVPVMIKDDKNDIEIPNGDKVELKFNKSLPIGTFETAICLFVEKSGQIEGSKDPILFKNYAIIWLGSQMNITMLLNGNDTIQVWLAKEDLFKYDILKICQEIGASIENRFKYGLSVEKIDFKNQNYFNLAITNLKGLAGYRKVIPLKKIVGNKHDLLEDQSISGKRVAQNISISANYKYNCFLAHEWGTNQSGNKTHERVKDIKVLLESKGLKVWFDEDKLKENIDHEIMQGVNDSRKILVFITKRYIERLQDDKNNCTKEFLYCVNTKDSKDIIPVVFEEEVENPATWKGLLLYHLPAKLYINLRNDDLIKKNLKTLQQRIES